jgi:hypothetical protein
MESKITNQPYCDFEQMCAYHQSMINYAHFQAMTKEYYKTITIDGEAKVERLKREFRDSNALYREKIL